MRSILIHLVVLILLATACNYENKEELYKDVQAIECVDSTATFMADIVPLLVSHCNQCHRNDRQDGDVNLEGYSNVKSHADDGSFYGSTNHEIGYEIMPPSGGRIPFCEIEKIRLWIEAGALDN